MGKLVPECLHSEFPWS